MADHSKETCPQLQYQDAFGQASMLGGFHENQSWNDSYSPAYDHGWCPQPTSWWNNNHIDFQFPQIAYQDEPSPPRRQSLEEVVSSLAQETQEYIQWSRESNQCMEALSRDTNFSFPTLQEAATIVPQSHDYFSFLTLNEEVIDDPYMEQLEAESSENHVFHYTIELDACGDSDTDESFWDEELFINKERDIELNASGFQVPEVILAPHEDEPCFEEAMRDLFKEESIIIPIVEPLSTPHELPQEVSLPISSSTHVPSIKEALEFDKGQHEYSRFQDHVEMVISEHHNPSVEIFLALHIEPRKRRWRWRRGKMKKSLESYLSIPTKGLKLLSRAHVASLMKVKHLLAPRPKPPDYS
ncbi:hypothetical protein M0R45_025802 [Rubus argutus]|uniref:Uncharacterized protein n=1 Tax=Rubus argutus TaxID=59490 RepID=A0AAW1WY02_RUBAR